MEATQKTEAPVNSLVIFDTPELATIEPSKADKIKATFDPMAEMLKKFEADYTEIIAESEQEITEETTKKAKRLRLDIGKVRIKTEKIRKAEKEEYLRAGKAIDGVSNILKWAVTDKENRLKEIEDHFAIMEQKRLEALQAERAEMLSAYINDAHERDLSIMESDVWEAYFAAKKKEYEDRIEAEQKAEEERLEAERKEKLRWERAEAIKPYYNFFQGDMNLEDLSGDEFASLVEDLKQKKAEYDVEQERIRQENERLKAEAAERERLAKIEADKREKEEAKRRAKEKSEREAAEKALKEEAEKRTKLEAELKRQEEERERIEAERKAKEVEEAEVKAKAEKAAQDKAHRAKINRETAAALMTTGINEAIAKDIVRLIASGKVPNLTITY